LGGFGGVWGGLGCCLGVLGGVGWVGGTVKREPSVAPYTYPPFPPSSKNRYAFSLPLIVLLGALHFPFRHGREKRLGPGVWVDFCRGDTPPERNPLGRCLFFSQLRPPLVSSFFCKLFSPPSGECHASHLFAFVGFPSRLPFRFQERRKKKPVIFITLLKSPSPSGWKKKTFSGTIFLPTLLL